MRSLDSVVLSVCLCAQRRDVTMTSLYRHYVTGSI